MNSIISAVRVRNFSGSANHYRYQEGAAILPSDRLFCTARSDLEGRFNKLPVAGLVCDPAKINRVPGGVTIPPLDRTFCHPSLPASTLKSASGIVTDGGQAKTINQVCELTGASPAPSPVRHFFNSVPTAAGIPVVSGCAVPITATLPVHTAPYSNSTEQTATSGPATGGSNVFQAEQQQCIEE